VQQRPKWAPGEWFLVRNRLRASGCT